MHPNSFTELTDSFTEGAEQHHGPL